VEGAFLANLIPEEKISETRNAADIVEVISEAVSLKRSGNNYLGLCPFHSEKTPSFSVSPDKQIFHCFGCGAGGNVFTFLMKQEGFSFPEAVRTLAQRYGVNIPRQEMTPRQRDRIEERRQLLAANRLAAEYFHRALHQGSGSERARRYLEKRGISREMLDRFGIGYAPDGWDNLLRHLKSKRVPEGLIEKCGLAVARKKGSGCYDRFRDRIVFPICDLRGDIIGFGGRVLTGDLPKYLNSPETPLYSKSRTLYGLHLARNQCRDDASVFVVEGYFDLIALVQHGVRNVVATLGTALTAEHARVLRGLIGEGGRVILVFDSDDAGIRAAKRGVEVFDKAQVNAQVLVLESGHDPDSFVFRYGSDSFRQAAENAQAAVMFLLETAIERHGTSIEGVVRVIEAMTTPLASISDSVERSLYVKRVAERLGIDETDVREKLRQCFAAKHSPDIRRASGGKRLASEVPDMGLGGRHRTELEIVAMMLQVPEMLADIRRSKVIELFTSETMQTLGRSILEVAESTGAFEDAGSPPLPADASRWVAAVLDRIVEEEQRSLVSDLAMRPRQWSLEGCRKLIGHFVESRQHQNRLQRIDAQIEAAERNQNQEQLDKLLREKQQLAIHHHRRKVALLEKP
jgi:DNA primase